MAATEHDLIMLYVKDFGHMIKQLVTFVSVDMRIYTPSGINIHINLWPQ